ncbi:MAG: bacterial transcriptional activator domain-containing protein [Lachnospiraceae bacterium]|nr:bacterial transcriptional activator domain-containing protein [Lachnospiraceae bacterium]
MKERPYTEFYARFLGGFSLTFGEQKLYVNVSPRITRMQILLILLKAGDQGIHRKDLLNLIRPDEQDWKKRLNNFHQQIHLLRKELGRSKFPEGNYIVSKESKYYFTRDYQVMTDTGQLDQLIDQVRAGHLDEAAVQELYESYCRLYTGEFLPMLQGEEWVTTESAYYQNWFSYCLNGLCEILRQQGHYEKLLEFCTAASQIHPYDEWQAVQIECLMALNRYKEAMQLYEQANELFYQDLGVGSFGQVMEKYQSAGYQLHNTSRILAGLKDELMEKGEVKGAYCCGYPNFLDVYHVITRMGERFHIKSLVLICSLEEVSEDSQMTSGQIEPIMEQLSQVITEQLRTGDVYTRYSQNQFLVLLVGATAADGSAIVSRLEQKWQEIPHDLGVALHFEMYETEESQFEVCENGKSRNVCYPYH